VILPLAWLMAMQSLATSPGIHELELTRGSDPTILYTLSIPEGTTADEPRPLVIALHFGGQTGRHFGRGVLTSLVEPGLRELKPIIAAPDSPGRGWTNPESEKAVLDLLDFMLANYPVDPDRVVLTGYSLGGMGTWYIASRNEARFSAAIPVAGAPRGTSEQELRTFVELPLYAIHSRADTVVPLAPTEEAFTKLRSWEAAKVELKLAADVSHYNTPAFVPYLRETTAWLGEVWARR